MEKTKKLNELNNTKAKIPKIAEKYVKKSIDYKTPFILSKIISMDNYITFSLNILNPDSTIGVIPRSITGPLLKIMNSMKGTINGLFFTIKDEASTLLSESAELHKNIVINKSNLPISKEQAKNAKEFRKAQKKWVKKPYKKLKLDGDNTPSNYVKNSHDKPEIKKINHETKEQINNEVQKISTDIKNVKALERKIEDSKEYKDLSYSIEFFISPKFASQANDMISTLLSKNKIVDGYINTENLNKLNENIKTYKEMLRKEKDNALFKFGFNGMEKLFNGYIDIINTLYKMISKDAYKPNISTNVGNVVIKEEAVNKTSTNK